MQTIGEYLGSSFADNRGGAGFRTVLEFGKLTVNWPVATIFEVMCRDCNFLALLSHSKFIIIRLVQLGTIFGPNDPTNVGTNIFRSGNIAQYHVTFASGYSPVPDHKTPTRSNRREGTIPIKV